MMMRTELDLNDVPLNPSEDTDTDGDGIGNNADTDDDGDEPSDTIDAFPTNPNEWVIQMVMALVIILIPSRTIHLKLKILMVMV